MKNILFVCTGNSARSIIAETIINNEHNDKFRAYSAGSNPTGKINNNIKKFLETKNYDLSNISSKNFDIYINSEIKMDHVITVCITLTMKSALFGRKKIKLFTGILKIQSLN